MDIEVQEMPVDRHVSLMIEEHIALIRKVEKSLLPSIGTCVQWIIDALNNGSKVLFAGNGGSAADAQHLAAEFMGRFRKDRPPFSAIALTTDTSILTALGNDYGFDQIFSRQVEGLIREKDIFVAISTSGNSQNLVEAVKVCRRKSVKTVGLLGKNGGKLGQICDLTIIIESENTARIQEAHITVGHIICELVENALLMAKA